MKQDAADLLQKGGTDGVRDRLDQDIGKATGGNSQSNGTQNAGAGQQQSSPQSSGTSSSPPGGGPQQQARGPGQAPGSGSQQARTGGTQQAPGAGSQPGATPKPPRFKLHAFDAITLSTKPHYRVKGFIPATGLVVIWGPPKCGKSFWTFDVFMHVALDWEYRGHKVKQGPVVYCAVEGGPGFNGRIEAWRLHYAARFHGPVPFWLIDVPINLIKDHKALIADIRMQTAGLVPAAVVIDTLNRSLYGSETDDEDMADYIRAADAIRGAFNCVTPIVHHCGIAANRPRGHTSLSGACDAQIAVARDDTNNSITCTVEHMKDGEANAVATSELKVIDLGPDDDGEPMTSCVIVPVSAAAAGASTKPGKKLSPLQVAALRSLTDCLTDMGKVQPASNHIPSATPCVTLDNWREYLFKHSVINAKGSYREQFRRLHVALKNVGEIGIWNELVWIV